MDPSPVEVQRDSQEMTDSSPDPSDLEMSEPEEIQKAEFTSTMTCKVEGVTCDWIAELPYIELFNPAFEKPRLTTSPQINIEGEYGCYTSWRIQVSHDFWLNNRERTLAIYLWRQSPFAPMYLKAHYEIQLIDKNGNVFCTRENGIRDFFKGACYGWKDYMKYTEPLRALIESNGSKLHIRAKIQTFDTVNRWNPNLSGEPDLSEINVISTGAVVMKAKKAVLLSKSQKFYLAIVRNDGSHRSEVNINVEPVYVLKEALVFMHEGRCSILEMGNSPEDIHEKEKLFDMAARCGIDELMVTCMQSICDHLTIDNFYTAALTVNNIQVRSRQHFYKFGKAYNKLQAFFRENVDVIKKNGSFSQNYFTDSSFFVDLLLGGEMKGE